MVFDGVSDGSVGIGLEVVGAAARVVRAARARSPGAAPVLDQRIVSVDGAAVRTATGRLLPVDGALRPDDPGPGDVLVVPGLGTATPPEIDAALVRPDILRGAELVARAVRAGAVVAASCSATFVLGASGVLDGGRATTTWWLGPTFARHFPRVSLHTDRMVVVSGSALTAGSAFAHADLMLMLVSRVARGLGQSPQQFVRRLRMERAVHLLETTQHPVDEIAARVGYADPAAFRRVFRSEIGETPRSRRRPGVLRDGDAPDDAAPETGTGLR